MQQNYDETSNTKYRRYTSTYVSNKMSGSNLLNFSEEDIYFIPGEPILKSSVLGDLAYVIDLDEDIPEVDILTGIPTGDTFKVRRILRLLRSLYIKKARERDLI